MKSMKLAVVTALFAATVSANAATPDLPSCDVWMLACHYTNSSRESSYNINRVVIHKTQGGTAAGSASWFANCASSASAHYNFDKSNGQCYQSVRNEDIAWHAGYSSTNQNSIGIEHSGWVANNDTSNACYAESAVETRFCNTYYAVTMSRTYVIGHSEVPGCQYSGGGTSCHSDPGAHWNWNYYMSLCQNGGSPPPPPPPPPPSGLPTYTVDNNGSGFAASSNWTTGTSASDKHGPDYRFRPTAAISDRASWAATVGTAGTYKVQGWWTAGTNRSNNADYTLPNNAVATVNQQSGGGAWHTLGTMSLATGARTSYLSCWTTTGFVVVADAVRYTP